MTMTPYNYVDGNCGTRHFIISIQAEECRKSLPDWTSVPDKEAAKLVDEHWPTMYYIIIICVHNNQQETLSS